MMRKKGWGKKWLAVSIPFVFLIAAVPSARADVSGGGQRLVNIENGDGTWDFLVTDKTAGNPSGGEEKITGVTGLGLLDAFKKTGNVAFLNAARTAGDHLVDVVFKANTGALPFAQDIEFLRALSKASGDTSFRDTAREWFRNTRNEFPNAQSLIDHFVAERTAQGRKALALWDVAAVIRAAVAVGETDRGEKLSSRARVEVSGNRTYARSLASRAAKLSIPVPRNESDPVRNPTGVDTTPGDQGPGTDNVFSFQDTLLSRGSLLLAFSKSGGTVGQARTQLKKFLNANRGADGSWSQGHTQITSYAVLGLKASGGQGVSQGTNFLKNSQLSNGGFPAFVLTADEIAKGFTTQEISEFDSEAVQAMVAGGASKSAAAKAEDDASSSPLAGVRVSPPASPAMPMR